MTTLLTNILSYYKLDETSGTSIADSAGSSPGTVSGATINQTGKIGKAVLFDAAAERITLSPVITTSTDFSFSAWVKPSFNTLTETNTQPILERGTSSPYNAFRILPASSEPTVACRLALAVAPWVESSGAITYEFEEDFNDTWIHVVGTWDYTNETSKLYLNGVKVAENSDTTSLATLTWTYIGMYNTASGNNFNGLIDELGAWSKALTQDEVTDLYNSGDGLAYPFTNTKTFTVDSILQKTDTKTFTIDSNLQDTFTKTFTIDSNLQDTFTKSFTIDSNLQDTFTKSFTIDSNLQDTFTKSFTIDAIIVKTNTKTFISDVLLKTTTEKTFTANALLQKQDNLKTFTINTLLKKEDVKTFIIDMSLKKTASKTFTIDSFLQDTFTKTFTTDAILVNRNTKTCTADVILQATFTKTFSIDGIPYKPPAKLFGIDAVLINRNTKTFTIDSNLLDTFTKTLTINSILQKPYTKTFSIDLNIIKTQTKQFTIDINIEEEQTKQFSIDAILLKQDTKTFTIDSYVRNTYTKTFTIDSRLKFQKTKTFTLDILIAEGKSQSYNSYTVPSYPNVTGEWVKLQNDFTNTKGFRQVLTYRRYNLQKDMITGDYDWSDYEDYTILGNVQTQKHNSPLVMAGSVQVNDALIYLPARIQKDSDGELLDVEFRPQTQDEIIYHGFTFKINKLYFCTFGQTECYAKCYGKLRKNAIFGRGG